MKTILVILALVFCLPVFAQDSKVPQSQSDITTTIDDQVLDYVKNRLAAIANEDGLSDAETNKILQGSKEETQSRLGALFSSDRFAYTEIVSESLRYRTTLWNYYYAAKQAQENYKQQSILEYSRDKYNTPYDENWKDKF